MSPLQVVSLAVMALGALGPAGSASTREASMRSAMQAGAALLSAQVQQERLRQTVELERESLRLGKERLELEREALEFEKERAWTFYRTLLALKEQQERLLERLSGKPSEVKDLADMFVEAKRYYDEAWRTLLLQGGGSR